MHPLLRNVKKDIESRVTSNNLQKQLGQPYLVEPLAENYDSTLEQLLNNAQKRNPQNDSTGSDIFRVNQSEISVRVVA